MLNQTQAVKVVAGGIGAEYSTYEFGDRDDFSDPV